MAVSSKIEEILLEVTKNIGNLSEYLKKGIGTLDTPSSAIFELNNLKYTAETGYPYFGIVETDPLGLQASYNYNDDKYNVNFTKATASYNGNIFEIKDQKIPIKKEFLRDYSTEIDSSLFKYGITVGLSLDEAKKVLQNFNTTVSGISSIGTSFLKVSSSTNVKSLGFPIDAVVGTSYIKFSGLSNDETALIVDSSFYNGAGYGTLPSTFVSGTNVNFVANPKLSYITGYPIQTTEEDPENFSYYPPLPLSWIPVAKILVERPDDPIVSGLNNDAIIRTVVDIPTSTSENLIFGNSSDVSDVVNSVNTAIKNLDSYKNNFGIQSFVNAILQYTNKISADTETNFNKFWSQQPFRPTQYYSKGLSFSGLERFEFPENFGRAYYESTGSDIQHTFAIFRGDLVKYNPAILSTSSVGSSNINLNIIESTSNQSYLRSGSQIYGVSAVVNISENKYLETVPSYSSINSTNFTNNNFFVDVQWSGVAITGALFYHVYKKQSTESEIIDKKLTKTNEVIYNPFVAGILNSEDSFYVLNSRTTAFNITPPVNCFIGGLTLKMGYDAPLQSAFGNSANLTFRVFKDFGGLPDINQPQTNETTLPYRYLKNGSNEVNIKFNNGFNATTIESYWLLIDKPSNLIVGSGVTDIKIRIDSTLSGALKYSSTKFNGLNTWNNSNGALFLKYRGFIDDGNISGNSIDRGVKLTNRIANIARRLSVYVPPIDDIIDNTGLIFNGSSVAIAATTDKSIKNDLVVTVIAKNGSNGTEKILSVTIPKGTNRNTRFVLGDVNDKFDRVSHVSVNPGINVRRINNGPIMWDIYDLITVETEP